MVIVIGHMERKGVEVELTSLSLTMQNRCTCKWVGPHEELMGPCKLVLVKD